MLKAICRVLGFVLVTCLAYNTNAQRHAPCGGNPVPLSLNCADACVVCDLNGVSARTTNTSQGQSPPGYCTMVVHSMQWLAFVAGSANLSINVAVSGCNQNNGVEMGIYASDDCQTFRLVSNCNTNMYNNQTWPFTTTEPLKIGCIYYLVFDGNGPNSCQVDFTVVSGSTVAPTPFTNNKITGKTLVCRGAVEEYTIPPINGACDYEWRVENGSIVSALNNKATVSWDQPGIGKICVKGTNICKEGNEVCLDVEIGDESPPTEFGPFYVCFGESYRFMNVLYTAGTWQFLHKNKYGCDSTTTIYVENLDLNEAWLDTILCFPDTLKIGFNKYDSTGNYRVKLKSKVAPFCDSTLFLKLKVSKTNAIPNKTNDLSCQDTTVVLYADSSKFSNKANIKYYWINEKGDTLSTSDRTTVKNAGTYYLHLVDSLDATHNCNSISSIEVKGSINPPDLHLPDTLQYCYNEIIIFKDLPVRDQNNTNANLTFHYRLPCDSTTIISDTSIQFTADTLIYLKASNAHCEDILAIPIKIKMLQHIQIDDVALCVGETLNLSSLPFIKSDSFPGAVLFYTCAMVDSSCLVDSLQMTINGDTGFYLYPEQASCPEFTQFKIHAKPIPSAQFALLKSDYCQGDTLQLKLNKTLPNQNNYYDLDGMTGSFIKDSSSHQLLQNILGQKQICIYTEAEQCVDTFCNVFNVHPLPQIPNPDCEVTDSTILFSWSKTGNETYTIDTLIGGPFIWLSDTSVLFYNLKRGQDIQIRIHAQTQYCGEMTNTILCQSKSCPPVNVSINPVDTICLTGSTAPLTLTAVSNPSGSMGLYFWRGPGVTDSLAGVFNPEVAGPGNHRVFVQLDNSGCKYFSSSIVVVRQQPFADFILDSIICQDSSLVIAFNGTQADSAIFSWGFDGADFNFTQGNKIARASWKTPGKKKLFLKLNHYKCFNEKFRDLEVFPPLPQPVISCEATDSFITFRWNAVTRVKNYILQQLSGNQGLRINDTTFRIKKLIYNDSASIQLFFEDSGPCGPTQSQIVWCKSPDCPPRNVVRDTSIRLCLNTPMDFNLDNYVLDPLNQMTWSGPQLNQNQVYSGDLGKGQHLYVLQGNEFGCRYTDSLMIRIDDIPRWGILDLDEIPCAPEPPYGRLELRQVNSDNPPIEYSLDGINYQQSPVFGQLPEGNYSIYIKDAANCAQDSSFVLIRPETPFIDLGPDVDILKGESVFLQALISGNYNNIIWSSPFPLSCDQCENPFLFPTLNAKLYCRIQNEDGCIAIDSIFIRVFENDVFVPNAFSPNGDQINDFFTVYGTAREVVQMEIYDRWGNRVFSKSNFEANRAEQGWNGYANGQKCMPGVYIYRVVVSFDRGENQVLHGDMTLIR